MLLYDSPEILDMVLCLKDIISIYSANSEDIAKVSACHSLLACD